MTVFVNREDHSMRKLKIKRENGSMLIRVIASTMLITSVVITFVLFMNYNNRQAIGEASLYLEDSSAKMTDDIENMLYYGERYINMMSSAYTKNETLSESIFSYTGFADRNGALDNPVGNIENVSDKEFFHEGLEGKSGFSMVPRQKSKDGGIVFYSPELKNGMARGVFMGYAGCEQIERLISDSVFGADLNTFLFEKDGDIIASSADKGLHHDAQKIGELFEDEKMIDKADRRKAENAIDAGKSCSLIYKGDKGKSVVHIEPVGESGLYITQVFPSSVIDLVTNSDNNAGLTLEIVFIVAFLIYIGLMIVINYRKRKLLVQQNRELGYIVKGMVKLFDRFIVVDFKKDTYKLLMDDDKTDIPETGRYESLIEYIAKDIYEDDRAHIKDLLEKEKIKSSMENGATDIIYEYMTADGSGRWENLNIICLEKSKGIPVRVLIAKQNVTDVKEEEEKYRQALKEAFVLMEKANNAKSRFLSQISHDIRTPMNAIIGMTTVAMMHLDEKDKIKDCLDKISISGTHLLGIINKVLDMSEIENGCLDITEESFDLRELMQSLEAIFSSNVNEKRQKLSIDVDIIHEIVIGDCVRLQQVFVNILGNAVKFTPDGGKIKVNVCEKESRVEGTGYYEFVFEDNGIGMSEEFIKKICEPFARENSRGVGAVEGSGLGMSIASSIIKTMNGSLKVESAIGAGSRFIVGIDLRLQEGNNEDHGENKRKEEHMGEEAGNNAKCLQENDFTGMRVLLVEDNELNMDIAEELLSTMGICTDKAVNGKEAVDKIKENEEWTYDMVFMDIQMPQMDGYEAAEKIRCIGGEYYSTVPIVAMSASAFKEDIEKAKKAGMDDYISKPVEVGKLIKLIETWRRV